MSIRHLDSLFDPASVAVIGASDRAGSVGATVWRNLVGGGYRGTLHAVNPRRPRLDGAAGPVPVVASVTELPEAPELAVICTPAATVAGIVAELGERGTRAAVVLSAGFDKAGRQALRDAARPHLLRILGPNCIGLLAPHIGLNASFAHTGAAAGSLAFVSQSGALVTAMLDWARGRGIGFSHFVSLGEHADVDFGDLLDWLASDPRTRAILLYIESIDEARKFMSAARAAARNKPVIVVKAGRSAAGQQAAASHTGALAGSDAVFDAAVRRAGMLRVNTLLELFSAAESLAHLGSGSAAQGREPRLTIVTNGGGAGVLAADAAASSGLALAPLADGVRSALDAALPANWSRANPVDLIGDAPVPRYVAAMQSLLSEHASGVVLFMHAPTAIVPSLEIAQALVPAIRPHAHRVLGCWLGDEAVAEARRHFQAAGIPCHDTPEQAVQAVALLAAYRRNQAQLMEAPTARPPGVGTGAAGDDSMDFAAVRRTVESVLADGREMLTEPEAKAVLAACGIPVATTRRCAPDADAACSEAQAIGYPVALKILSADISHKSDVGGVVLDLHDAAALRLAAGAMLERVRAARPDARIDGFTVQQMVRRSSARELIVGSSVDPLFGPVILFGQGGTAVEVVADRALALPPLNEPLARALIGRTRVARLLAGYRDVPAVKSQAVVDVLLRISALLAEVAEVAELDINPLLADADGVIALDARVRVAPGGPGGAARFAIRPYPHELVEHWDWHGETVTVRPIRPDDEARHRAFLERLSPEDIRLRIFYSRRSIERSELARLTQIDYEREMAFVVTRGADAGDEETLAVVRAVTDPDNLGAEFGIVVRSDLQRGGLGGRLMDKLIGYLRGRGTGELVADVLNENDGMLALARRLGFEVQPGGDAGTRAIRLEL